MIDLHKNARPDEQFFLAQCVPTMTTWGRDWVYRSVKWTFGDCYCDSWFTTYILFWCIRWYVGSAKVDGGRTLMLRKGELGAPYSSYIHAYVITTTPKEMYSFRLRWRRPDRERPLNMGGI
mgnify:FL=1